MISCGANAVLCNTFGSLQKDAQMIRMIESLRLIHPLITFVNICKQGLALF